VGYSDDEIVNTIHIEVSSATDAVSEPVISKVVLYSNALAACHCPGNVNIG
jgi:hypothetical protein